MEETIPAYLAMGWSEYKLHPFLLTRYLGEGVNFRDMTGARPGMRRNEIHVTTLDDLHKTMTEFLTQPIIFKIQLEHHLYETESLGRDVKIWRDDVAVIVNPKHQGIRDILTEYFTTAIQIMESGQKFSLKLDFAPSVAEWHSVMIRGKSGGRSMDSGHMEVWITNADTPMECVANPWFICCCFPLWCVMCGPYFLISRGCTVTDMHKNFSGFQVHFISHDLTLVQMFTPSSTNYQQTREEASLPRLMLQLENREEATREREERIYRVLAGDLLARPPPREVINQSQAELENPTVSEEVPNEAPPTYEEATKNDTSITYYS